VNAVPHIVGMDEWIKQAEEFRARNIVCDTWLYFIRAGADGPVKIGVAADPWKRLETLQIGNHEKLELLAICYSSVTEERLIHRILDGQRIHGEWFKPTDELMAAVRQIQRWNVDDAITVFPQRFDPKAVADHEAAVAEILAADPDKDEE